jgi:hypothetical protein
VLKLAEDAQTTEPRIARALFAHLSNGAHGENAVDALKKL